MHWRQFRRTWIAMASLTLTLMVMACGQMTKSPAQVAGTYVGVLTLMSDHAELRSQIAKFPTTAVVTQDSEDVTIQLSIMPDADTTLTQPSLTGRVDKDGKLSLTGTIPVSFTDGDCGGRTLEAIPTSIFEGDEFRLAIVTATENCGTVTQTLIAQKTG